MHTETAYNQALDYLYSFVDYSLKHASELAKADFNLDRMFALMDELGNPQTSYPVIHVAGTKGKGSTCAFLASALHAADHTTGLYTSPHLEDFAERIQIDGQPIPHGDLADLVEEIKPHVEKIPFITTFELTTAVGLLYFQRRAVDVAVVEVGLGGRLDATNILTPEVAVITSLSYDHTAVLGHSLGEIAAEKAGIIKPGKPVVSSPQKEEALVVLEKVAGERGAALTLVGRDVFFETVDRSLDGQRLRLIRPDTGLVIELTIPLLGAYQVENAATAYTALELSGMDVSEEATRKGFYEVKWPARFQVVRREPPLIFDSAHNLDSAQKLRQALDDYFPDRPAVLIFGASEDKDVLGMFAAWRPRLRSIVATKADHPRALEAERILEFARQAAIPAEAVTPVSAALQRALELAGNEAIVLSSGSMFITAEVMTAWRKNKPGVS